jgi:phytoene synthase
MAGAPRDDWSAALSNRVAAADRDRWLASLFLPEDIRPDIHALLAFSAEIATVRDHISAPLAGEIRLQWWRDALADPGEGRGNPLAEAVAVALTRRKLPVAALDNLIAARVFDLYDDPMPSLTDLEGYFGETASALFQLTALALAGGVDPGTADLSGHAGVAYGLTGLMRALSLTAGRGQCYLPADRLAAHGGGRAEVVAGEATPAVLAVLGELRAAARRHLTAAETLWRRAPAAVRPAFLPLALVGPNLAHLQRRAATPFAPDLGIAAWRRPVALWWAARRL